MKQTPLILVLMAILAVAAIVSLHRPQASSAIEVHRPAVHDVSAPLASLRMSESPAALPDCASTQHGCGTSPDPDGDDDADASEQVAQQVTQQGAPQGAARGGAPRVNPGTPPV